MGSKKHKKESKKKKHRSRSRSPLEGEERERRRHHKKHKDRKKDRSPDDSVAREKRHRYLQAAAQRDAATIASSNGYFAMRADMNIVFLSLSRDAATIASSNGYFAMRADMNIVFLSLSRDAATIASSNGYFAMRADMNIVFLSLSRDAATIASSNGYFAMRADMNIVFLSLSRDAATIASSNGYFAMRADMNIVFLSLSRDAATIASSNGYFAMRADMNIVFLSLSRDAATIASSNGYFAMRADMNIVFLSLSRDAATIAIEEVPVDSHLQQSAGSKDVEPRSRSTSEEAERDRRLRDERHKRRDAPPPSASYSGERSVSPSGSGGGSGARAATSSSGNQESLSIEETNRIRAKLGLKPLETADRPPAEDGKLKDDLGEFYHVPATNIALQKKTDKIRERLQEHKEKRKLEQKLQTTLLAEESDGEDDPTAWIKKSREIEKQKKEAAKRAALLDEMDLAFGVSALVAQEERSDRERSYTARQLQGLRVAHDYDALGSERDVVLTLADKEVLAEDDEDVLVNVNLLDTEKYNKNIEERKKAKAGYKAYDDEADLEAAALGLQKQVLAKYDDEIDKSKAAKERGFVIGDEDGLEARRFRQMMMRERMQGNAEKRLESLMLPELRIASDYYDEHEIQAKFKKPKKKGKIRKRPKHEPIDVDEYDPAAALLETDDTEVKPELLKSALAVDEDELEPDSELQIALARARRLRQVEATTHIPKVEEILERVKEEDEQPEAGGSTIMLDATAEFCRTLGDIPTYGQAGNRDHRAEILDFEREEMELDQQAEGGEGAGGAWSRVDVHNEQPPDIAAGSSIALDAEPSLGAGVAGALQLALSKGYLEKAAAAPAPRSQHKALIAAINYSIEDKTYGEDDKHGRRERGGYSGPLQDFREKSHFKPNIKLEYVDDDGRALCPKEAFRYLSHKFHGKGPGKNKQEKRIKKAVQEGLMKKMSSTDTPLNTLALLQEKQKETHSPYVLLSGAKRDQHN